MTMLKPKDDKQAAYKSAARKDRSGTCPIYMPSRHGGAPTHPRLSLQLKHVL